MRKLVVLLVSLMALAVAMTGCSGGTDPATAVTDTSATLNAHGSSTGCTPNACSWYWQWGPTGNVTQNTSSISGPVTGTYTNVPLSHPVTGLTPNTAYQFRICAKGDSTSTYSCTAQSSSSTFTTQAAKPHVIVIMEENMDRSAVVGNTTDAPYYNSLPQTANWHGTDHPSLPNYLTITSGGNQGISSDCYVADCGLTGVTSVFGQLAFTNTLYASYAEDMPSQCYNGGGDAPYAERHNPQVYYTDGPGVSNQTCPDYPTTSDINSYGSSKLISDLNSGSPPSFVFYTPNTNNDGHDTDLAHIDASLNKLIPAIEGTSWWTGSSNREIVVEWDEADPDNSGSNSVATAVVGTHGPSQSSGSHCGTLRSIEDTYGVPDLGCASGATKLF